MNSDPLWSFPTGSIVEGIQVDSVLTQEFIDFQNHWLSADKAMFPESSFDTTEVKSSCMLYWHSYSLTYMHVYTFVFFSLLMTSTKLYLLYWTL